MTENLHADCVQSRQAGFVRCCLNSALHRTCRRSQRCTSRRTVHRTCRRCEHPSACSGRPACWQYDAFCRRCLHTASVLPDDRRSDSHRTVCRSRSLLPESVPFRMQSSFSDCWFPQHSWKILPHCGSPDSSCQKYPCSVTPISGIFRKTCCFSEISCFPIISYNSDFHNVT